METPTIDVFELMLEWCEWAYWRGATSKWMAQHAHAEALPPRFNPTSRNK
jgi:hypothetical protein